MRYGSIAIGVIAVCCISGSVSAGAPEPWLWTAQERAAKRFDPGAPLHIEGKANPELFFPVELFSGFVEMCFANPRSCRTYVRQHSDDLFLTDADWNAMEPLAEAYAAAIREEARLLGEANGDSDHDARLRPAITAAQARKRAEEAVAPQKGTAKVRIVAIRPLSLQGHRTHSIHVVPVPCVGRLSTQPSCTRGSCAVRSAGIRIGDTITR